MRKGIVRVVVLITLVLSLAACKTTTQSSMRAKNAPVPTRNNSITAVNPRAYHAAYEHFYHLAKAGDPTAQLNVGRMYADGRGVPMDDKKALKWFQKAAAGGCADATVSLGAAYWFAKGTKKDSRHACKLFMQAWRKGNLAGHDFYSHYCA